MFIKDIGLKKKELTDEFKNARAEECEKKLRILHENNSESSCKTTYIQRELGNAILLSEWLFELELPTKRVWDQFQS